MDNLKRTTYEDYRRRMLAVLDYIQDHLDEEISLETLASVACFSAFHFHRIFRGMVGESVMAHVRRLRLERAAGRLKNGRNSVIDIALEAGYETHESFTRAFGEMFGLSPTDYRKTNAHQLDTASDNTQSRRLAGLQTQSEGANQMKVEIVQLEPVRLACVRHVGPYDQCSAAWEKLCLWAGPAGLLGAGVRFIGLSYDDPDVTEPDKIRYDACITVDDDVEGEGDIVIRRLEGGKYAMTTHFGPYEKLSDTYAALCGQWIPAHGYEIASLPAIEQYQNSPEDTEPEDLITDIYIAIEDR